jgi:hypothetical protein
MRKSKEQIAQEYHRSSPEEWLEKEFGDFFSKMTDSKSTQEEAAAQALDRAIIGSEIFESQEVSGGELLGVSLRISGAEDVDCFFGSTYTMLPTPETLLMLCNVNCSPGERVDVTHYFANEIKIKFSSFWPFGMDTAVMMTTPNGLDVLTAQVARERRMVTEDPRFTSLSIEGFYKAFKRDGFRGGVLYLLRVPNLESEKPTEDNVSDWILDEIPESLEIGVYLPARDSWPVKNKANATPRSLAILTNLGIWLYRQIRQVFFNKSESSR